MENIFFFFFFNLRGIQKDSGIVPSVMPALFLFFFVFFISLSRKPGWLEKSEAGNSSR